MSSVLEFIIHLILYGVEVIGIMLVADGFMQKKFRFTAMFTGGLAFIILMYVLRDTGVIKYQGFFMGFLSITVIFLCIYKEMKNIRKTIQNVMVAILVDFFVQFMVMMVLEFIKTNTSENDTFVNGYLRMGGSVAVFVICYIIYKKNRFLRVFDYIFEKNKVLGRIILSAGVLTFVITVIFNINGGFTDTEAMLYMCFSILFIVTLYQWNKASELSQEKDRRIMIQQMCQESYEQLLIEVRNRQHEFQNHLAALQGMCYSCQTIEELTELQSSYCDRILVENKYNKLLYGCNSPIVGGFLYSKFSKADEKNIETDYQISINPKKNGIDEFELIEMVGILYDNAVEALESASRKKMNVNISEDNGMINISVDNVSPFISSEEMMTFFHRGVSTKGKNRGIGLAKLQKTAEKYDGKIITENKKIEGENWLSIKLILLCEK